MCVALQLNWTSRFAGPERTQFVTHDLNLALKNDFMTVVSACVRISKQIPQPCFKAYPW